MMRRPILLTMTILTLLLALPAGSAAASSMAERPFRATFSGQTTSVEFAAPGTLSTFGGRCSVPSSWTISFEGFGHATHLGAFTWTSSHCTQAGATPFDPVTISDGHLTFVAANGDLLYEEYGNGVVSVLEPPLMCIDTQVTFDGGTGRFEHAFGTATERGCFSLEEPNLPAVADLQLTSVGTVAYDASDRA